MAKLNGKIALITGGNSGIGLATAQEFIKQGAKVIITGRRQEELDKALEQLGPNAHAVRGDVSNLNDLDALYTDIRQKYGHLDIIFANAGVAKFTDLATADEAHFDQHFNINVKGLFFTVQKALPILKDGASIIMNASAVNAKGFANFSVYSATKAAVRSFARSWANDLKERNIRINVVSPGPIETPLFDKFGMSEQEKEATGQAFAGLAPLGRFGAPSEIATAVSFLASDESSYVTGIDLPVDGGIAQV